MRTENCQNLIIGFKVTVKNVGDVFLRYSVYILFFSNSPTGQTLQRIFARNGSNDAVLAECAFLGLEN